MNYKLDFTHITFKSLLQSIIDSKYEIQTFKEYLRNPRSFTVILRHDIDKKPDYALDSAIIEQELGISGSYYFRIVSSSYNPNIIRKISDLNHEIGYHYEDLTLTKGNIESARNLFIKHLAQFRSLTSISTICMHGSPLSKWDNRQIWKHYSYRDIGIIGEPYFDLDFNKVAYLTDTGRKWNGDAASIRDKVTQNFNFDIKSTEQLINAFQQNNLPNQMMITVHPQRWTNNKLSWVFELATQNIKNIIKKTFFVKN